MFLSIFLMHTAPKHLDPFHINGLHSVIINTFDPFIFGIHVVGLILWGFGADPGYTFSCYIWHIGDLLYCQISRKEEKSIKKFKD